MLIVSGADDDIRFIRALGRFHPYSLAVLGKDAFYLGIGNQLYPKLSAQLCKPFGSPCHPFLREEHPQLEIHMAHDGVDCRRLGGIGTKKHHGVLEDLLGPSVADIPADKMIKLVQHPEAQTFGHQPSVEELTNMLVVTIEEILHRHLILVGGLLHVLLQCRSTALLEGFEQLHVLLKTRGKLCRLPFTVEDFVVGIERAEVKVGRTFLAKQAEVALKHLRHEIPRGSHVEGKPILVPIACPSAKLIILFDQRDTPPIAGKESRCTEAAKASPDDKCCFSHTRSVGGLPGKIKKEMSPLL
ncbi:hypothetical protein SDC9_135726 [bioreactor metagenome]|uniref:Uncharacterized protein n=1 Tax=bioreactor metagenome TaxID=1076179 RepID=A0A645DJ61_9ZZZZ